MSIRLNLNQARQLLEFFGGEDADVTLNDTPLNMHSGPGLYAWLTEHPDEGSIKLDREPQPADEDGVGMPAADYLAKVEADPMRAAALQRARDRAGVPAATAPSTMGADQVWGARRLSDRKPAHGVASVDGSRKP